VSGILAWQEPIIAGVGLPLMIWFELQLGEWIVADRERWLKRFRSSRLYRWLNEHEPGVRINSGTDSLIIGWVRA
jgi:hypothetical protein